MKLVKTAFFTEFFMQVCVCLAENRDEDEETCFVKLAIRIEIKLTLFENDHKVS